MIPITNHTFQYGLESRGFSFETLSTDPTQYLATGRAYVNPSNGFLYIYNGTAFVSKTADSTLLNGQNAAYYLARGNHTGTQLAATISDFNTTVRTNALNQMATATASFGIGGFVLQNVGTGTQDTDAANIGYVKSAVQNAAAGIDSKPSVRLTTAGTNDTLAGLGARDGITPVAGDRILVPSQTDPKQNGVYIAASGAWSRAADADQTGEITSGATWYVEEGSTAYGKSTWRVSTTGTITLGTTSITIDQIFGAIQYSGINGVQISGSNISAVVVAGGGLTNGASGLAVDSAVVVRKAGGNPYTVGDGTNTVITVTHSMNTLYPAVTLFDASGNMCLCEWRATGVNTVQFTFGFVPTAGQFKAQITG